eukprot:scpid70526/ scgid3379/ StAR-related lipid transfer protein 3; Metastatic lymph node gene 64 protein; Protein CAB1; START domain-containing protein 3
MSLSYSNGERTALLGAYNEAKIELESTEKSFHILTIFNFLLTIVLWLIEAQETGLFKGKRTTKEIFDIHSSLADLVLAGFLRAFVLLLLYSILSMKSRYIVWTTTLLNTLYLVIKVILFEFSSSHLTDIILGVGVFILAWVELLYFETKVVTSSRRAASAEESSRFQNDNGYRPYGPAPIDSRTPPLNFAYPRGPGSVVSTGSVDNFQTPRDSPTESLLLEPERQPTVEELPEEVELSEEHRRLVLLGQRTLQKVWSWYSQPVVMDWAVEKITDNVQIHTMDSDGARTIRIQAQLPFSAAQVFRICYFDNHLMAEWDATVKESKLLERIDDHTNIVYNLANEIGGGVISSRDFVSLLHWDRFEDVWVSSGIACTHKDMPPQPNVVRGENGVCGFICKPTGSSPPKCSFVWYLTTDLKGWLPKSVIQRSLASVQILFIEKLEQRLASLASL